MQSEANNDYSTAVAPTVNHDFMLWPTCCIKLKCIVGHPKQAFVPSLGSAFAFLVVLHLPAALELRRAGSGLDLEACSC